MKKLIILYIILAFVNNVSSQGCLPNGITFPTQASIDSFQIKYPGCTNIQGNVIIKGNSIQNLLGLNCLTKIDGMLYIHENPLLESFTGLDNIDIVSSYVRLRDNDNITDLTGFGNLKYIGGDLQIVNNENLETLSGISSLESIDGKLKIFLNKKLSSINSLNNLDPYSVSDIYIYKNSNLSECKTLFLCDYLASPNGSVNIYSNATGCNNPSEILELCDLCPTCLPYGNYVFVTQNYVDNFQYNYPNCKDLKGSVIIGESYISNLNGLIQINSIDGDLIIKSGSNSNIINLSGLHNLKKVYGSLFIKDNENLVSLEGLHNLDTIGSNLRIESNSSINNLTGLSSLNYIGEDLRIRSNGSIRNFNGLQQITYINGDMLVEYNSGLRDFTGLENLNVINGSLTINRNVRIGRFHGLHNLQKINRNLEISSMKSLKNFMGLAKLDTISSSITIEDNDSLIDITGIENMKYIGGNLHILNNPMLTSLNGLDNISIDSINLLRIISNENLTDCSIQSICEFMSDPPGIIVIYANAPGCDNPPEIASDCGFTMPCLPFGNYHFWSQDDIDRFPTDYPNCHVLNGTVWIKGNNIVDLTPLQEITSIGNDLFVYGTSSLVNFNGLNNITSIGGNLRVGYFWYNENKKIENFEGLNNLQKIGGYFEAMYNDALTSFSGLNSLQTIGGSLTISFNQKLTSLTGLDNLDSINGNFELSTNNLLEEIIPLSSLRMIDGSILITGNGSLKSLTGLQNIDPNQIDNILLKFNYELSDCAISSICEYISDSIADVEIRNNSFGCNSPSEVEYACTLLVNDSFTNKQNLIYPNPATGHIYINNEIASDINSISIYDIMGQLVRMENKAMSSINVSFLKTGLYVIEVTTATSRYRYKMIKQ